MLQRARAIDYFDELSGFWPADRYVFIDDKQKVLTAAKKHFEQRATTVLVQQGRYADSSKAGQADHTVASITDIIALLAQNL